MESTEKGIAARKILAWYECHKLKKGIDFKNIKKIEIKTVFGNSGILHGAETRTLTKTLKKQTDGT